MSLRIYVAAPWIHRDQAREAAGKILEAGHMITRAWWDHESMIEDNDPHRAKILAEQARKDLFGVQSADLMIVLNSAKSEGKAVEQGIAIDMELPIIGVGARGLVTKNIFHYLACYRWVSTIEDAIKEIPWFYKEWHGEGINRVQP